MMGGTPCILHRWSSNFNLIYNLIAVYPSITKDAVQFVSFESWCPLPVRVRWELPNVWLWLWRQFNRERNSKATNKLVLQSFSCTRPTTSQIHWWLLINNLDLIHMKFLTRGKSLVRNLWKSLREIRNLVPLKYRTSNVEEINPLVFHFYLITLDHQVVWNSTKQLGCGKAVTKRTIAGTPLTCTYFCCRYGPTGKINRLKR